MRENFTKHKRYMKDSMHTSPSYFHKANSQMLAAIPSFTCLARLISSDAGYLSPLTQEQPSMQETKKCQALLPATHSLSLSLQAWHLMTLLITLLHWGWKSGLSPPRSLEMNCLTVTSTTYAFSWIDCKLARRFLADNPCARSMENPYSQNMEWYLSKNSRTVQEVFCSRQTRQHQD